MPASFLADLAADLLAAAYAGLDQTITGNPAPDRVYISHGEPAWDFCDGTGTLVVFVSPISHRQIASHAKCWISPTANFCVELIRCVPSLTDEGSPPPAADLTDSAESLLRDIWSLLQAIYEWFGLFDCEMVDVGQAIALGPAGGAAGWRVCLSMTLSDPDPPNPVVGS